MLCVAWGDVVGYIVVVCVWCCASLRLALYFAVVHCVALYSLLRDIFAIRIRIIIVFIVPLLLLL